MPPLGTDADAALRSILDVTLVQAAASPSGPLFLADLAAGFPFQRVSMLTDIGFVVSSVILAYMSWTIMEKPRR